MKIYTLKAIDILVLAIHFKHRKVISVSHSHFNITCQTPNSIIPYIEAGRCKITIEDSYLSRRIAFRVTLYDNHGQEELTWRAIIDSYENT